MPVSADTLLRLATTAPRVDAPAPRVLGVDEWAWSKGHRYGTILVDLERGTVVDLLPLTVGSVVFERHRAAVGAGSTNSGFYAEPQAAANLLSTHHAAAKSTNH
ncbi:hypothetical protein [Azospirillum doebereinerae]